MKRLKHSLTCLAICLLLPGMALAQRPVDFEATLELYRNGKLMGETKFSFTTKDDTWIMKSETRGTKGLARFIGFDENSFSKGEWKDDVPRPTAFERNIKAIRKMQWTAEFDWGGGVVHSVFPDGETSLDLQPGVVDQTAIGLMIRSGLESGEDEWFLPMLDEDEIEMQHFKTRSIDNVQTPLGCMKVHNVEKVRDPSSRRYTRTYYAEDHNFVPVMIEHGKKDDDHMESRIVSITIEGKPVQAGPDCK